MAEYTCVVVRSSEVFPVFSTVEEFYFFAWQFISQFFHKELPVPEVEGVIGGEVFVVVGEGNETVLFMG